MITEFNQQPLVYHLLLHSTCRSTSFSSYLCYISVRYDYEDNMPNSSSQLLLLLGRATMLDPRYRAKYLPTPLGKEVKKLLIDEGDKLKESDPDIGTIEKFIDV